MANKKISELNEATSINDGDKSVSVQSSETKWYSFTTLKIFLKTYFDTIYTTTSAVASQITTALSSYVPNTRTINTKALSSDVTLVTDDIAESGTPTNKWWTNARTIASTLTGFTSGAGTVSASDTILQAIQKIVGNLNFTGLTTNKLTKYDGSKLVDSVLSESGGNITNLGSFITTGYNANTTPASEIYYLSNTAKYIGRKSSAIFGVTDSLNNYDASITIDNTYSAGSYSNRTTGLITIESFGDIVYKTYRSGSHVEMARLLPINAASSEFNLPTLNSQITFGSVGGGQAYLNGNRLYNNDTYAQVFNDNAGTFRAITLSSTRNASEIYTNRYIAFCKQNTFNSSAGVNTSDYLLTADFNTFNIGIGTTTPASCAILDLSSTSKGFLPTRGTQANRLAIGVPVVGLEFTQTDGNEGKWQYQSNGWMFLGNKSFETIPPAVLGNATMNQNIYGYLVTVPYDIYVVNMSYYLHVYSAGSTCYMDVYDSSGTTRIGGTSHVATSIGDKTASVASPFTLRAGTRYWFTMRGTDGTAQYGLRGNISQNAVNFVQGGYGTGASPSTVTITTASTICPYIRLN